MIAKTFKANTVGRDFVVGDIHGVLPVFNKLLSELKFDKSVDRMFSVGDLVDRGPDSLGVLKLLDEKWFFSVQGNHEQMMFEAYDNNYMAGSWVSNGGGWGLEGLNEFITWKHSGPGKTLSKSAKTLRRLAEKASKRPFVITVKTRDGENVHIIHAELWSDPPVITDKDILDRKRLRSHLFPVGARAFSDGQVITWGRNRFEAFYGTDLSNIEKCTRIAARNKRLFNYSDLGRVVSGHTVVQRPLSIGNFTNIDTGSFMIKDPNTGLGRGWAKLTVLELNTWKFYSADYETFGEVQPVVITV